jgi:hypothetical protein
MATHLNSFNNVGGISEFLLKINLARPDIPPKTLEEIKRFIERSGCAKIFFLDLSNRAMGISKTNECIINSKLLTFPLEYFLYILFHEVAHQYQYKKHGKNYVLSVYSNLEPKLESAKKLLEAERIADRLAIAKVKSVLKNCNIRPTREIIPRYLNLSDLTQIEKHLENVREIVSKRNLKTIEEINDAIESLLV